MFVKDAKSKKSLKYLETSSLRVGTTHLVWRDLETAAQVKRSIVSSYTDGYLHPSGEQTHIQQENGRFYL